ncbi:hypothetical protein BC777_2564 [Yoonia maricola]|uniref:Lipoprotein n=1 Tax=Yoonia maricola TaxID=420999 RepID=A0A2M8W5J9_9RHOB|nr:hypothetical protein [Yoonia maricola]PJI86199.1 hypothetical protein BC777_2564 [Yoonia maricola]
MTKLTFVFAAALLTAGCATNLTPTEGPVSASVTSAAVSERLANGRNETMVRAYLPADTGETGLGAEVAGAECSLTSDELTANVTTPQAVILPSFKQRGALENRGVPGAILVDCEYQGQAGRVLLTAQEKDLAVVSGAGVGGLLIGLAVSGVAANTTPWSYGPVANVALAN